MGGEVVSPEAEAGRGLQATPSTHSWGAEAPVLADSTLLSPHAPPPRHCSACSVVLGLLWDSL